ncbi:MULTISPECIES: helix-turn-helix domain-containing protein [Bacillus]|uniref:helix-turn-helix domain-containing protein n=1 Tax=Bacillus TaxID=1386 RepID=UPI001C2F4330|nr:MULTISPECIES: helix-turn-helix transcriptional regulator [Bacillus]
MSFAEILRKAMDETNMSQAQLSKMTGIGESSISQYVSGELFVRISSTLIIE